MFGRSLDEKKGRGIYRRVLHYTVGTDIRPLSSLAEVKTLSGSCTLSSHFFADTRKPGEVLVRDAACLNCSGCSNLKFDDCENMEMCGKPFTRRVQLVSNARSEAPPLRSAIQLNGLERAKQVTAGMFVGSENAEEKEPFIISLALGSEQVWVGPDGESWNGVIKAGERYIQARKLHRESALVYCETDLLFYMNSEDVRVLNMIATERAGRRTRSTAPKTYVFVESDIEILKNRVDVGPTIE